MQEADGQNPIDPVEASVIRGSNQTGMRAHNERLVLSLIRKHGPMAKAAIARITGLSAQTVSVIMRALEADGLLVKGEPVRGKVGQPSVPMGLRAEGAYFLGLKVGRRSVELVLTDFLGEVLQRAQALHSHPTPDATIAFAKTQTDRMLATLDADQRNRVAGMGIAMPFFLWNWAQSLGVPPEDMAFWRVIDIRAEIAKLFDFPVYLQNDASAACGAELVFGASDRPRDFLYFYVGFFIGGGVVLNGALFSGKGNSGALGPLPVPGKDGQVRQLLDVASLTGLENRLIGEGIDSASMWTSPGDWKIDETILEDWITSAASGLAHSIVAACSVIDFQTVLIDGWLPPDVRQRLVDAVMDCLDQHNMTGLTRPKVLPGSVGADARVLGAVSLPLSKRFLVETNDVA